MKTDRTLRPLKWGYMVLYYFVFCIAQVVVRILYPVRALGKENLPAAKGTKGLVYAPNHISAVDPLFLLMARGLRPKMLIMGKEELFKISGILNFFWAVAGCFAIERGAGERSVVEDAMHEVQQGRDLLIYPEGTRSKTGEIGRIKSGAFVVAMEAQAQIVPVLTWYKAGKPKPFQRCTIVFGKPLTLQQLGIAGPRSAKALREAKNMYVQQLKNLQAQYADKL